MEILDIKNILVMANKYDNEQLLNWQNIKGKQIN